jgi:hypothetical protein
MRIRTLALAAVLPVALFADGNTSTATATASVTILAPVTVAITGALNFGNVVVPALPATISIDANKNVTFPDGTSSFWAHSNGGPSIPTFTITKDASASVNVLVSATFAAPATLVIDPSVRTNALNWGSGNGTAYTNKPIFGVLNIPTGSTLNGTQTGQISITANYI